MSVFLKPSGAEPRNENRLKTPAVKSNKDGSSGDVRQPGTAGSVPAMRFGGKPAGEGAVIKSNTVAATAGTTNRTAKKGRLTVKKLRKRFQKNGLGYIDAAFNALFFYYSMKSMKRGRKMSGRYKKINMHPLSWSKDRLPGIYENNKYDRRLLLLEKAAKIYGVFDSAKQKIKRLFRFRGSRRELFAALLPPFFRTAIPACAIAFAFLLISSMNALSAGLEVYLDGRLLGIASDMGLVQAARADVESGISLAAGAPYIFEGKLEYRLKYAKQIEYISESELYGELYAVSEASLVKAYGLYIDGKLLATAADKAEIEEVLESVLDRTRADAEAEEESVEFSNEIEITSRLCYKSDIADYETLKSKIELAVDTGDPEYIQFDNGILPLSSIYAMRSANLNAFKDVDSANAISRDLSEPVMQQTPVFDEYAIDADLPPQNAELQIKKTKIEVYSGTVPYGTVKKESSHYQKGVEVVQTAGTEGVSEVTARVSYIGSEEVEREIIEEVVVTPPKDEVILVGTLEKAGVSTGKFMKPINAGYTGDTFNLSKGSKRVHTGIDYVAPYGTPVYASDGGTVISAQYSSSYGNCVVIQHSGGYLSRYAHFSKILVKTGEKVSKGQQVGLVGSTGNSTGNHLHFEIERNKVKLNPADFIGK